MRSPSLDVLYTKNLDRNILLVQSYTEINDLFFIFKSCRLKPYDYVFKDKRDRLILYRHWFDEFNNSLYLNDKKVNIVLNDLKLQHKEIVCTDLYYGLSIEKIAKISKFAHMYVGKDEDLQQDCVLITFLGIDNYLRSFMYLYGEWQQVSPLLLGLGNLKIISQNKDIKYFLKLGNQEKSPIPCINPEQWLTFLPPRKEFLSTLALNCPPANLIFNKE